MNDLQKNNSDKININYYFITLIDRLLNDGLCSATSDSEYFIFNEKLSSLRKQSIDLLKSDQLEELNNKVLEVMQEIVFTGKRYCKAEIEYLLLNLGKSAETSTGEDSQDLAELDAIYNTYARVIDAVIPKMTSSIFEVCSAGQPNTQKSKKEIELFSVISILTEYCIALSDSRVRYRSYSFTNLGISDKLRASIARISSGGFIDNTLQDVISLLLEVREMQLDPSISGQGAIKGLAEKEQKIDCLAFREMIDRCLQNLGFKIAISTKVKEAIIRPKSKEVTVTSSKDESILEDIQLSLTSRFI